MAAIAPAQAQVVINGTTETVPGTHSSPWNIGNALTVGGSGSGALAITSGGTVSSTSGRIGDQTGSNGSVSVTGPDANWTVSGSGDIVIGSSGTGVLTVTNGGTVVSYGALIGSQSGGSGTATLDGAGTTWTMTNSLIVGSLGTGRLDISGGATINGAGASIGSNGSGVVTVSGPGTSWLNSGVLLVGLQNNGRLTISDGAKVTSQALNFVGYDGMANGIVEVTGPGSTWTISGDLTVGYFATGTLNITNGGVVSDTTGTIARVSSGVGTVTVDGAGSSWINSGKLTIGGKPNSANSSRPGAARGGLGSLTISNGGTVSAATVQLGADSNGQGVLAIGALPGSPAVAPGRLDSPTVDMKAFGTLVFNHSDTSGGYVFSPDITGTGMVQQLAGITVVTGANTYSGATEVDGGSWRAGVANTFSPNSVVTVGVGGRLELNGFDQRVAGLNNAGLINMGSGTAPGTILTTGNYVGLGGTIAMNTYFGADNSPSDKLVIDAGTATGSTSLRFTNAGGPATGTAANGILVVEAVNGATTATTAFIMTSRDFRLGKLDYRLFRGALDGSADDNWYLRSTFMPGSDSTPGGPGSPGNAAPIIGPEPSVYSAVQPLALQLGLSTLGTHDERMGDQYLTRPGMSQVAPDPLAEDGRPAVWGRLVAQQLTSSYQGFADPKADSRITVLQSGMDLLRSSDAIAAGHRDYAGIYFAYGNINADISGLITNAAATAYVHQHTGAINLDAWSGGAYWTHYGSQGWYLELVLHGTSYQSTATTDFAQLKTSGIGFISSLEGGYPIPLRHFGPGFVLEPQAQILWQRVSFDSGHDALGAVALGSASLATARVGLKGSWNITDNAGRVWIPHLRVNYWQDIGGTGETLFDQDPVLVNLRAQYVDATAGFTTRIDDHLSGFVDAGYQFGVAANERHGVKGIAGLRYRW
ncbi:MAG: autotransporter outer membrane beta-barrel domain-containing protein [Alphaproteobacteria bacterium]|nr:autotransporter outer membrane beta-barrel domain-containing protein [Alphaproteobacteria bacterium]